MQESTFYLHYYFFITFINILTEPLSLARIEVFEHNQIIYVILISELA